MKRVISIFLILLLSFAGISSTLHQLEENGQHCHVDDTHICAPDAHHHCSLCDTVLSSGIVSSNVFNDVPVKWFSENTVSDFFLHHSYVDRLSLGRAPPLG